MPARQVNLTIRGNDFEPYWHHGERACGFLSDYRPGHLKKYDGRLCAALVFHPEENSVVRRVGVILYSGTRVYFDTHTHRLPPYVIHEDDLIAIGILGKENGGG